MLKFFRQEVPAFLALIVAVWLLQGCSAYFHQPTAIRSARLGEATPATAELHRLPTPREKVVAAVYKFRDQTGQYRPSETGANWSTAVTQGATNILLKALEESGWFVPIERENVSNLLNERKIIRSSMAQYKNEAENLPPLLFAGIILEGGIVSYDANVITGGAGIRYFGTGGSSQYRQDRVTVYLRAVATKSGKILKTIYTSKTILSQSIDGGIFRYVRFKRLLEAESGFTTTEPSQLAVTEAIEKAVHSMIMEGIQDNLWTADEKSANDAKEMLAAYDKEKADMSETDLFGARSQIDPPRLTVQPYALTWRCQSDYTRRNFGSGYGLAIDFNMSPFWSLQVNGSTGNMTSEEAFDNKMTSLDANVVYRALPYQRVTPLILIGAGYISQRGATPLNITGDRFFKLNTGLGIEYAFSKVLGVRGGVQFHQPFTDELDGRINGRYNDYYWQGNIGLSFYVGRSGRRLPGAGIRR